MPKVHELVGALEAETDLAGQGGFTLDRDKARIKMRQFQLPDPRMYVLSLVQVAVLQGAESIEFLDLDAHDTAVVFGGAPLRREDIEELYASLLGGAAGPPARQELAIAVNGAMAIEPKFMRISICTPDEKGEGRHVLEVTCRPDTPDEVKDVWLPVSQSPGTRIHVKEKFSLGMRFFDSLFGELAEGVHLRERCRWARIDVRVRGASISREQPHAELLHRVELEQADVRAVAGFDPGGASPRLRLLCHGVWIEDIGIDGPLGLRAACDGGRFRKNVSRTGVVQDEAFDEAMHVVERAREQSLLALATVMQGGGDTGLADARALVLAEIERAVRSGIALDEGAPPWLRALADLRLWPSVVANAGASTWELARDPDGAGWVSEPFAGLEDEWRTTVLLDDAGDRDAFLRLFPRRVNRTADLRQRAALLERRAGEEARRADDHRKWRQRPHPPKLPDGAWAFRRAVDEAGITGEVGISSGGALEGWIHLVADGCLLRSVRWTDGPPATHAVVQAAFTPTFAYDGVLPGESAALAIRVMLRTVRKAWRTLARRNVAPDAATTALLLEYLAIGERTNASFGAYHAVGFDGGNARRLVREAPILPAWRVGTEKQHPIASCRAFRLLDGGRASLFDVHRHLESSGQVPIVRAEAMGGEVSGRAFAVVARARELAALSAVFGARSIVDRNDLVREDVRRRAESLSIATLREALRVPAEVPVIAFAAGELSGALAFAGSRGDRRATIALLDGGTLVTQLREEVGVPEVVAAVEVGAINLERDASGPSTRARERIVAAVEHGIGVAVAELARAVARGEQELEPVGAERILGALRSRLRSAVWLRAYAALVRADAARADAEYVALVRLAHGTYWDVLASQVGDELARGGVPTAESVARALRIRDRVDAPCPGLLGQLVEAMPALGSLTFFRRCSGRAAGLAEVATAADRGRVGVVAERHADPGYDDSEGLVVVADGIAAEVVQALADLQLTPATRLFAARERRRIAEARPVREAIAIADGCAVVTVRVDRDGWRGELGLARPDAGRARVEVCVRGRPIGVVHPNLAVAIVGVLDREALDLDFAFAEDGLAPKHWRAVERIGVDVLPELLVALARHGDTPTVAALVRRVLLDPAVALPDDLRTVLEQLPAFAGVDGRFWSKARLHAHARDVGEIDVVPPRWQGDVGDAPVIAVAAAELADFRRTMGRIRDHRIVAEAEARRGRAPAVTVVPADAIGRAEVSAAGLRGVVWIDDTPGLVELVAEGKVVGRVPASPWWPVRGFVEGDAVAVAADWSSATLDGPGRAALQVAARRAFEDVLARYDALLRGEQSGGEDGARVKAVLKGAAGRLARARALPEAEAAMKERMEGLPLFERSSGVLVSLEEARVEKVASLRGVWDPGASTSPDPSPEPSPSPSPEAEPEPEPELVVGELAPGVARVVEAVRDHLRSVFQATSGDPAHVHLHRITARPIDLDFVSLREEYAVVLNTRHPLFEAAERSHVALCLLASSAYTTLNLLREDVTDDDEARFHDGHAERILAAVATRDG